MNRLKQPSATAPCTCQSKFDKLKIESLLLERILRLSKKEYALFLELAHGWELDEIDERLTRGYLDRYTMDKRMRSKLVITTTAMLRYEATRYVVSGITRQEQAPFVFVREGDG